jgi:hypothetical protein
MGWKRVMLAAAVGAGLAGPASALSLAVTASGTEIVGAQMNYTVSFTPTTNITGYDLTIMWDTTELTFSSASALFAGFFAAGPPAAPGGRIAGVLPVPSGVPAGDLFRITFLVAAGYDGDDGAFDDFMVYVNPTTNGAGVAGPVGATLSIDNPMGFMADGLETCDSRDCPTNVPAPTAVWLLGTSLAGLALTERRRRARA